MHLLCHVLVKEDIIKDHTKQYGVEHASNIKRNVYEQRFSHFGKVGFPKYRDYDDYVESL